MNFNVDSVLRLTTVLVVFAILAVPIAAIAEEPVQIRQEYGGKDNTPDHLMFGVLLRTNALRYEQDPEFAIEVVQQSMRFETSESARKFVSRMLAANESLERTRRIVNSTVLCHRYSDLSRADIYRALDSLDDARLTVSRYAYLDFRGTLSDEERVRFEAWLDDAKEGYSFTAFDHASLFENRGIDVRTHVDQLCIDYAQDELRRAQE